MLYLRHVSSYIEDKRTPHTYKFKLVLRICLIKEIEAFKIFQQHDPQSSLHSPSWWVSAARVVWSMLSLGLFIFRNSLYFQLNKGICSLESFKYYGQFILYLCVGGGVGGDCAPSIA